MMELYQIVTPQVEITQEASKGAEMRKNTFGTVLRAVAAKHGIEFYADPYDWLMTLEKDGQIKYIYGNNFPLNNQSSARVCSDKAAGSDALQRQGVPHIPHHILLNPLNTDWTPARGVWIQIQELFELYQHNLVLKPKEGSGGEEVIHVQTAGELEAAVQCLFGKYRDLLISPYKKIGFEYRAIVLDGEIEILFKKIPPYVVGDGVAKKGELVSSYLEEMKLKDSRRAEKIIQNMDPSLLYAKDIPEKGEIVRLNWKHNLGQGAECVLIGGNCCDEWTTEANEVDHLIYLAKKAALALDIRFASVDIVELENGEFCIMEVNSGIMTENLMTQYGDKGVAIATRLYEKAILKIFHD